MKILLTGFGPFPGVESNPSRFVVETLAAGRYPGFDLETAVLPVDYVEADDEIRMLVRRHRPDIVLLVGVASKEPVVRLERVALNLDDAALPDNRGVTRRGEPIVEAAAPAYFSNLPLREIESLLAETGVPVRISNHAGAYLCNHVYFAAMHESERMDPGLQVGFIHIPMVVEYDPEAAVSLAGMVGAVRACLSFLAG